MRDLNEFSDMPATRVVAEFLNEQSWDDEIEIKEGRVGSTVATPVGIEDQPYKLYIEANEKGEVLEVYLYSPYLVPVARLPAMSRILNRINSSKLRLGRLAVLDDGDPNPVQFKAAIDFEGGAVTKSQVSTMVQVCFLMSRFHHLLSAVALTKASEDDLWNDFLEDEKSRSDD